MNAALLPLLFALGLSPAAEPEPEPEPSIALTVGYYGPYVIHPGVELGADVTIRTWDKGADRRADRRRGALTKTRSVFTGPRVAFFGRPQNHLSFMLGVGVGYRTFWDRRKVFSAWSLGASYLGTFQTISRTIDLSSGATTKRVRETQNTFLPTLTYSLGQELPSGLGWYLGLSLGRKLSFEREGSMFYALNLGLLVRLGSRSAR